MSARVSSPSSTATNAVKQRTKPACKPTNGGGGGGGNHQTVRLRVVVRHLPSLLKEEDFKQALADVINDETTESFQWRPGKISDEHVSLNFEILRPSLIFRFGSRNKPSVPSRCHIKFKTQPQVAALSEALRLHGPFTDSKGNASIPQIEFSPSQKHPKKASKIDARSGTIETDPEYIAFLASIDSANTAINGVTNGTPAGETPVTGSKIPANDPLSVPLPSGEKPEKPTTTPLIEYLRTQKTAAPEKATTTAKSKNEKSTKDGKESRRRRGERSSRGKGREREREELLDKTEKDKALRQAVRAVDLETTTILKRENPPPPLLRRDSAISATSPAAKSEKSPSVDTEKEKEKEKDKDKERRDRKRGAAGVAAILQRDLGLGPRRTRAPKTPTVDTNATAATDSQPTTPLTPSTLAQTPATAEQPSSQPSSQTQPQSPKRSRRSDRRNRTKPERENSNISNASATSPALVAILKKQSSNLSTSTPAPQVPILLRRDSSAASSNTVNNPNPNPKIHTESAVIIPKSAPASDAVNPSPTTPIAPRRQRGPRNMGPPQTPTTPPTGPAVGNPPTGPSGGHAPTAPAAEGQGGKRGGRSGGGRGGHGNRRGGGGGGSGPRVGGGGGRGKGGAGGAGPVGEGG
ncbi:hypothetical protein RUND412_006565 [Rhizina undulata]